MNNAGVMAGPSRLQDRRPAAHPEPRVLLIRGLKRGRVLLCVLPLDSTHATTSLTSHENLLGNCFANAVVIVSAMT